MHDFLIRRNCQTSLNIHVELLLGAALLQVFRLFTLVLETGLPFGLFPLFAFEVKLEIKLGGIFLDV
jgi:hypothetical protein